NSMEENTSYPLIIYTSEDGDNSIKIDELVNIDPTSEMFLHDKELDYYHDFKKGDYEFFLNAGYYDNRFEIVFYNPNAQSLGTDDDIINQDKLDVRYANNIDKLVLINPHGLKVNDIQLFNILGQHVLSIEDIKSENLSQYNVGNLNPGTYIIKLNTVSGSVSKKVLIN
ncbi:putative secreted protein (Por secretion system target), partial [Winogradskyella wandonensis]